jgi:hypothetical protein
MPADPTAANPHDHSKLTLTLTASAQANGEPYIPAVLHEPVVHPRDPSPRKCVALGLDSEHRTAHVPVCVIAEGADS